MTDAPDVEVTRPVPTPLKEGAPDPCDHTLRGRNGEETILYGVQLAAASSQQQQHQHLGEYAPPTWRCGACRWFEVTIYRLVEPMPDSSEADPAPHPDARYVVHTVGCSNVPGEIDFARVAYADTPFKILELLTQWNGPRPKLPNASAEVIEVAAELDPDIDAAYDAWVQAGVRS